MTINVPDSTHVLVGSSAASSIQFGFELPIEQILVADDSLSCGPAPAGLQISEWLSIREEYSKQAYPNRFSDLGTKYSNNGLLDNIDRLIRSENLVAWTAAGLTDQLTLAFLFTLLQQHGRDASELSVVAVDLDLAGGFKLETLGAINPESLELSSVVPRRLNPTEISDYVSAWEAYTSSDPNSLEAFLSAEHENQAIVEAMRTLIFRYPSKHTGLSVLDEEILGLVKKKSNALRILLDAIGYNESLDSPRDYQVEHRFLRMGSKDLASPLIDFVGDAFDLRQCEATITPFGSDVLEGQVNVLEVNGIDDWIGGVHLTDPLYTPLRDDGNLTHPG